MASCKGLLYKLLSSTALYFLTLWTSCLCPQTSNSGWFYSQHPCSSLDTWRSGLIFLHMPSESVFSICPWPLSWIFAHSDAWGSVAHGQGFLLFPQGSAGGSWGPVSQQIQPTVLQQPSARAPSEAPSFPALTPALRAQKNWPTPPAGFCISEICATWCRGFYTAQTGLPIDAWCVGRTGAQHAGEPSAAPGLPDFQQHGWTCCYCSSQPEQGNV